MARRPRTAPAKPRVRSAPAQPAAPSMTLEQAEAIIVTQRQHVEACRAAFFRLAQARAADMVVYQHKDWSAATDYINAEMQSLDQNLAAIMPPQGQSE